jgi:hypothetical protein
MFARQGDTDLLAIIKDLQFTIGDLDYLFG